MEDPRPPHYVQMAFAELADGKQYIDAADLAKFFVFTQGEVNMTEAGAASLISHFHQTKKQCASGSDSLHAARLNVSEFLALLSSPELNSLMNLSTQPTQDMNAPLSHYLIYASHNSYLTGNQLTSEAGTATIVKALLSGCKVIELDCWDHDGVIKVLHGHTLTKPVSFEECLRAIKENAFATSDYPVIITIENHLPLNLQRDAARIIRQVFGDLLFVPSPDERPPKQFASPDDLRHKIIISDTPSADPLHEQAFTDPGAVVDTFPHFVPYPPNLDAEEDSPPLSPDTVRSQGKQGLTDHMEKAFSKLVAHSDRDNRQQPVQRASELEELIYIFCEKPTKTHGAAADGLPESGETAIMANLSETQLKRLVKADASSTIRYTRNNLGRMYPFGLRFNSSNANPFLAWAHGFQLAAINIQGHDRSCWTTQALFDQNGRCGYVKKPHILLHGDEMAIANMVPKIFLQIKVLTGTDCYKAHVFRRRLDMYVKVSIDGFPSDKERKKTYLIRHGEELNWEHQLFQFPIRVPEMAVMRLEVWEQGRLQHDSFVGQACFAVAEMRVGIRAAALKSRNGDPLHSRLLCWVRMEKLADSKDTNTYIS